MKRTIKLAALCCIAALAFVLSSCEKKVVSVQLLYNFAITEYNGDIFEQRTVEDYIKSKTNLYGAQSFEAQGYSECDKQCKEAFDKAVANFSYAELDALGLSKNTSFAFTAKRYSENKTTITIGEWRYPKAE